MNEIRSFAIKKIKTNQKKNKTKQNKFFSDERKFVAK